MKKIDFKPMQWVLMRDKEDDEWTLCQFSHLSSHSEYPYVACGDSAFKKCIPYKGNKHLRGTTDPYVEPNNELKFEPKDGDFVKMKMTEEDKDYFLMIYHEVGPRDRDYYYACMYVDCEGQADNEVFINSSCRCNIFISATDEEKQHLLSKLRENGKDWDAEKKEIVEYKWKPVDNEAYYFPSLNSIRFKFEAFWSVWDGHVSDLERKERNFVFRTEAECQALCEKLNAAIKNIK